MQNLMDLFSNREKALIVWLLVIVMFAVAYKKSRIAIKPVIRAFFAKKVILPQLFSWVYVVGIIFAFSTINLWNTSMFKDSIIWTAISSITLLFGMVLSKRKKNFIKDTVVDVLKIMVAMEFLVNMVPFSFTSEMFLLPILTFIGLMVAVAGTKPEYLITVKFFNGILALFGLYVIYHTVYEISTNLNSIDEKQTALDFLLPVWLTLTYIPYMFLIYLFDKWEQKRIRKKFSS